MTSTRDKLLTAASDALREEGVAAISARGIAARAGVNQALVFYHFNTVGGLLLAASKASIDEVVLEYRAVFADVTSLGDLARVGRLLHQRETERGNVAQMAQVLAGAQHDPSLAEAGRYALERWSAEVEVVLRRVLADGPLDGLVEPAGLARMVAASFVGLELLEGVDESGAIHAWAALDSLLGLVAMLEGLGPVATRALRRTASKSRQRGVSRQNGCPSGSART